LNINSRARRISEWVVSVILGLSFVASGLPKIMPGPGMIRRFEAWGYSAQFATGIGVLESLGGVLVLFPRSRRIGAGLIAIDMAGAVFTHVRTGIGSPVLALAYLVLAALLAWFAGRSAPPPGDQSASTA
jgi:uncharacterized membrane protein YphA (DoxX/SURF4 family)